jgi:hypothetical protein
MLYLGERTSHTGVRRLVIVTCDPTEVPSRTMGHGFDICTATIAGWGGAQGLFTDRPQFSSPPIHRIVPAPDGEPKARFFAGQPDPADPAAFTIGYELDAVRGAIRGTLADNGGWVEWVPPSLK